MSSPIRHAKDLDAVSIYAPPWARSRASVLDNAPSAVSARAPRSQPITNARRGFSGDRAMPEIQRQLALDPDKVPEPQIEDASRSTTVWFLAVTAAAAIVAFAIVSLTGPQKLTSETERADASATPDTNLVQLPSAAIASPLSSVELTKPNTSPVPTEAIQPPESGASPSVSATLALDSDEIATLIKRGQDSLQYGDVASARLLLRRAAEAGNANAALALGMTYDPTVIKRLGVIGIAPDTARARKWYQKATDLGSGAASERLTRLENVP